MPGPAALEAAILAGVAAYVLVFVIADFTKSSVHPEVTRYFLPAAIATGRSWHWGDFAQAFNWEQLDHLPRTRFLSYVAFVANAKLRLALVEFTPLPPAFSFTWLCSLVVAPALLYRLVMNMTGSRRGALVAATVYLCSPGTLSAAVVLFHPAKPMAVSAMLGCLVWASEVGGRARAVGAWTSGLRVSFGLLLAWVFVSMSWDESAWFVLVALPLLFPGLLRARGQGPHPLLQLALVPACFLAFTILLAPLIVERLGFGRYDMLGYLWAPTLNPLGPVYVVLKSALNILGDHLVPWWLAPGEPARTVAVVVVLAGLGLLSGWLVSGEAPSRRGALTRVGLATAACAAYQGMLAYKHPGIVEHCFYYASSFAPFFALLVGVLSSTARCGRALSAAVTSWIVAVSLSCFQETNRQWIAAEDAVWVDVFPAEAAYMAAPRPLTNDEVSALWMLRRSPVELEAAARTLPISALWWVTELRALEAPP